MIHRIAYHLTPETHDGRGIDWFADWEGEYEGCPQYENGDRVLGVAAATDTLGGTMIRVDVLRTDGRVYSYSPYYNQFATDPVTSEPDETLEYDYARDFPEDWLSTMSGATDWHASDWHLLGSFPHGYLQSEEAA